MLFKRLKRTKLECALIRSGVKHFRKKRKKNCVKILRSFPPKFEFIAKRFF